MKKLILATALWMGLAGGLLARTVEDLLLASLEAQGYVIIEQGYTLLGRLRIVAVNGEIRREIVINPGTGEILRDYAILLPQVAESQPSSGHGASGNPGASPGATVTGTLSAGADGAGRTGQADGTQDDATNALGGEVALDAIVVDPAFQIGTVGQ